MCFNVDFFTINDYSELVTIPSTTMNSIDHCNGLIQPNPENKTCVIWIRNKCHCQCFRCLIHLYFRPYFCSCIHLKNSFIILYYNIVWEKTHKNDDHAYKHFNMIFFVSFVLHLNCCYLLGCHTRIAKNL